ncbi:MAG: zonular occludens toxin domain-containing protein [Colwellia sp.]
MAISAYTGLPGHGKSYGVVDNVIAPALKQKRIVFTNIPIKELTCQNRYSQTVIQFEIQEIIDNPEWWSEVFIAGAVIVIDELWRLWPAGVNTKNIRDSDKSFLAEHRHLVGNGGNSTEIIFVTQDLSQIATFARNLVETTYRVTKLSKLGASKRFRIDIYFGPVTGVTPPKSKKDSEIYGKFKQSTYDLYQSHTKSEIGAAGDESRIDNRFNIFKGKFIYIILSVLLCLIVFSYTGYEKMTGHYSNKPNETTAIKKKVSSTKHVSIVKKPIFKFLSKADDIFIIYNNGVWPNIEYLYKVTIDNSESEFTFNDFQILGYEVEPINKCMVKLKGPDFVGFAMCQKNEEKAGWLEKTISSTDPLALN